MIPKRNLLKEKLDDSSSQRLTRTLTALLKQGTALLYSCETIRRYTNLNAGEMATFRKKIAFIKLYQLVYLNVPCYTGGVSKGTNLTNN